MVILLHEQCRARRLYEHKNGHAHDLYPWAYHTTFLPLIARGHIIPLLQLLTHQEVIRCGSETQVRQHRTDGLAFRHFRERSVCPTGGAHTAQEGSANLLGIGLWSKRQVQDGVVPVDEIALDCALGVVGIALR